MEGTKFQVMQDLMEKTGDILIKSTASLAVLTIVLDSDYDAHFSSNLRFDDDNNKIVLDILEQTIQNLKLEQSEITTGEQ